MYKLWFFIVSYISLTLGTLFSTVLRAVAVAKPVIFGILPSISLVLLS